MTMNPARMVILGVALIAAIGLAFILRNIALPTRAPPVVVRQAPPPPTVRVLVAAKDLAPGDRLNVGNMAWQGWPADSLNASYITEGGPAPAPANGVARLVKNASTAASEAMSGGGPAMQALSGAVVREAMVKGEPILKDKVVRPGQGGFMSVILDPGMRAISIPVSAETGAGGFIQPGDRVDVIQTGADPNQKSGALISQTVLSNVRVLAVDQTTTPAANGKSILGATLTLEVPASLAELAAGAKSRGGLNIALRSYADMGGPPGTGGEGTHGVRLFRGGEVTQVMVTQ
ncbi:MAG TPA: Flp pilus assembly protein CpaB [Caulobacteraceae bacterium]|nr:Flp pilus assembly protein CpaB [Caulobacteraceae bacterium]